MGDKTEVTRKPRSRRANRQGSVKVTPYGVTARVRLDGQRRERRFASRAEAEQWIEEQVETRSRSPEVTGNWTVAEWLEEWLQGLASTGQRRGGHSRAPRTIDTYAWRMEHFVLPALASYQVKRLDRRTIEWLWNGWDSKGIGGNSIADAARTLRQALDAAVRREIIPINPAVGADLPARPRRPVRDVLTLEEWRGAMDSAEGQSDQVRIAMWLAGAMALRRGEIAGLQWPQVHLDEAPAWLEVTTNAVRVRGRGLVLGEPKSEHSRRQLAIPTIVVPHLQSLRERASNELVLTSARGGIVDPRDLGNRGSRYLHELFCDLPAGWGLHGLRHTLVTLVGVKTNLGYPIQRYFFGHSDIPAAAGDPEAAQSMTLRLYTHGRMHDTLVVAQAIEQLYAAAATR